MRNLSRVVSPPYDVISQAEQEEYYRASPYNVIRLELGKCFAGDNGFQNRYTRAQLFFKKWFSQGILVEDHKPSIYIYEQRFRKGRRWGRRLGFIALLQLDRSGKCSVYPHEKTFASPKEDRTLLLKSLKANVSPLFFLFPDRRNRIEKLLKRGIRRQEAMASISCSSEHHRMWRLTDLSLITELRRQLSRYPLFIADGHHRYEVALAYQKKARSRQGKCVMAYFSNLLDKDLTILPIHRLVRRVGDSFEVFRKKLTSFFTWEAFPNVPRLLGAMEKAKGAYVFGVYWKGRPFYLLRLKSQKTLTPIDRLYRKRSKTWRRLDVTLLHTLIFKKILGLSGEALRRDIFFSRDVKECVQQVREGTYEVGFFLRPPRIHQIRRIALSGEKVPQKSTYFYPKPMTGLIMYRFREEER